MKLNIPDNMGCSVEQLATVMINKFQVKEAFMVDGGTEATMLYNEDIKNGRQYVPISFRQFADNKIPNVFFVF